MKITKTTLLEMLGGAGARYVIPVYQRAYSWTESQCDAFWDDAVQTARDCRPHYTGVSLYRLGGDDGASRKLILVDGQQRLATATLLLAAMRDFVREGDPAFADELDARYLTVLEGGERISKIVLSRFDRPSMDAVVLGGERPEGETASALVHQTYDRYFGKLRRGEADAREVLRGLELFSIVMARLEADDKPQLVYESLNAKGSPLRVSDLVRNLLLTRVGKDEQRRLFELYWEPLENTFDELEERVMEQRKTPIGVPPQRRRAKVEGVVFDAALHAWATRHIPRANMRTRTDMYGAFKRHLTSKDVPLERTLESISTTCLDFAGRIDSTYATTHIEWVLGKPEGFGG